MSRHRLTVLGCAALLAVGGATALLVRAPAGAAQGLGELRSEAEQQRGQERTLAGAVARLGRIAARVERQLAVLAGRRAEVEAELAADRARLARVRGELRRERKRLARLRARLTRVRAVLADRLVALYKDGEPELATIALSSRSFADLVERIEYSRRVQRQDAQVLQRVRRARRDAIAGVRRLTAGEARQQRVTAAVQTRRDAVAAMESAIAARRAALERIRGARAAALQATTANRRRVERRIRSVEAQQAREQQPAASAGPSGPWVIPWPIVQCESGGQNIPPNSAGASGYYQIIPSTWKLFGGRGPHAYLASKAEQDRVAARIWSGGRGKSNWVCAALVDA